MASPPKGSPSPPQGPVNLAEEKMPEGYCRYLLPQQELRGQRCGCTHFTLNRNIPSSVCYCGHQSCFHTTEPYLPEMEQLKNKIKALETQVDRAFEEKLSLVARVSTLEEIMEKSREEVSLEIKGTYHNLNGAWRRIEQLERGAKETQLRLGHHGEQIQELQDETRRLGDRQLELNDADISLEERVEVLEEMEDSPSPLNQRIRRRRSSLSDRGMTPPAAGNPSFDTSRASRSPGTALVSLTIPRALRTDPPSTNLSSSDSNLWTVHISLLPTSTLPFPFEKDTNAYKRCLSRGLHQMVVVQGHDADSVVGCVSRAFGSILKDRAWMPLQALLCNAQSLQGLPMLRKLDESLVHGRYDSEFLRRHCAVCDANGKMDSLYIAMRSDELSWHTLRRSTPYVAGLESCWQYDPYLDPVKPSDEDDAIDDSEWPSAGDIMGNTYSNLSNLSNLKRAASEMSRSSSFGAATAPGVSSSAAGVDAAAAAASATSAGATDGEGSRPKIPRVMTKLVEGQRRRVTETC